jgi:hypothetical protein
MELDRATGMMIELGMQAGEAEAKAIVEILMKVGETMLTRIGNH